MIAVYNNERIIRLKNYWKVPRGTGYIYYFRYNDNEVIAGTDILYVVSRMRQERKWGSNVTPIIYAKYFKPVKEIHDDFCYADREFHLTPDLKAIDFEYIFDGKEWEIIDYNKDEEECRYKETITRNDLPKYQNREVITDNVKIAVELSKGALFITENGYTSFDLQDAINHIERAGNLEDYEYDCLHIYAYNFFNNQTSDTFCGLWNKLSIDQAAGYAKSAEVKILSISSDRTHIYSEYGLTNYLDDDYKIDYDLYCGAKFDPDLMYRLKDKYKPFVNINDKDTPVSLYYQDDNFPEAYIIKSFKDKKALLDRFVCFNFFRLVYDKKRKKYTKDYSIFNLPFIFFEPCKNYKTETFLESEAYKEYLKEH